MNDEVWRVADLTPTSPAHLVGYQRDGLVATACNWVPSKRGQLISRAEMSVLSRFACVNCLRKAAKR